MSSFGKEMLFTKGIRPMIKRFVVWLGKRLVGIFHKLILKERSAKKLALSVCTGLYIAFCPFLFMHTAFVLGFSWLFSLNMAAVFAGAVVNNPWTMIPCHTAGYMVGEFFFRTVCRIDPLSINPGWMSLINEPIFKVTGIRGISFWSFMIGGNLLAVVVSVMLYPVLKLAFARLSARVYAGATKTIVADNEDSCSEQKSIPRLRHPRPDGSRNRPDR